MNGTTCILSEIGCINFDTSDLLIVDKHPGLQDNSPTRKDIQSFIKIQKWLEYNPQPDD